MMDGLKAMGGTAEVHAALQGLRASPLAAVQNALELLMGTHAPGTVTLRGSTVPVYSHVTDRSDVYSLGVVLRGVVAGCYWAPDVAGMPTCTLLDQAIRIVGSCMEVLPWGRPEMALLASDLQLWTAWATVIAAGP